MAFFEYKNVRIAGIAAGVPKNVVKNEGDVTQSRDYNAADFVKLTGVAESRFSEELTTSDLSYYAAERLLADLGWEKDEIGVLVFVSQTSDYVLPATACILQDRLGLSKDCYASDVSLGCSGWVYGLSQVVALLSGNSFVNGPKKALLLVGDAKRRAKQKRDPLFGHAGTATAIEFAESDEGFKFHFGTNGSGFDAIIMPGGGSRNPVCNETLIPRDVQGKSLHQMQTHMKGIDVVSFGISTAPRSVKSLAKEFGFNYLDYDYFVFHQANMAMNHQIAKNLKLPLEKVPYCMKHFGNTSSASIPLTIVTQLKEKVENGETKFICCGFGVGLSWGTTAFTTRRLVVSDLVEVTDEQKDVHYVV